MYINVLAIQTPSFLSVTPFCLSKHNEKNQVYHKQFTSKNLVGCDTKYLGAPSCLAYAGTFVVHSPPPALEPHLRASFSLHRANFSATAEISISLPPPSHRKPHFHCSSLLSKFKPSLLLTGSSASSPPTLLLAAPLTLLLAVRPRRYGQVIHTPPTPSSSFPVPHALTDGPPPFAEITGPVLQLSTAHNHFARSITWSSVASDSGEANRGRTHARGRYGCHVCRPPDLGGAPRLRGHRRHHHAVVYFKIQFVMFSRGHH